MPTKAMPNGRKAGVVGAVYGIRPDVAYRPAMANKKRGCQIVSNAERKFNGLAQVSTGDKGAMILRI